MEKTNAITSIKESMKRCIELPKCRKCACLQETLVGMKNALSERKGTELLELLNDVETSLGKMESTEYA